jgi:hypothetical protein
MNKIQRLIAISLAALLSLSVASCRRSNAGIAIKPENDGLLKKLLGGDAGDAGDAGDTDVLGSPSDPDSPPSSPSSPSSTANGVYTENTDVTDMVFDVRGIEFSIAGTDSRRRSFDDFILELTETVESVDSVEALEKIGGEMQDLTAGEIVYFTCEKAYLLLAEQYFVLAIADKCEFGVDEIAGLEDGNVGTVEKITDTLVSRVMPDGSNILFTPVDRYVDGISEENGVYVYTADTQFVRPGTVGATGGASENDTKTVGKLRVVLDTQSGFAAMIASGVDTDAEAELMSLPEAITESLTLNIRVAGNGIGVDQFFSLDRIMSISSIIMARYAELTGIDLSGSGIDLGEIEFNPVTDLPDGIELIPDGRGEAPPERGEAPPGRVPEISEFDPDESEFGVVGAEFAPE